MPVEYTKDDARRRIRIVARDPLSAADVIATIDRQAADQAWSYGTLYDARGLHNPMGTGDVPDLLAHVRALVSQHGPRGPVAIVTRSSATVAVGHVYSVLGGKMGLQVETFWDIDEAERWLDARGGEAKEKP